MVPRLPHRAWLLAELRRLEWRRLLLAVALLAVWARLLAPLPGLAASERVAVVCAAAGETVAPEAEPAMGAHDDRRCPFCRVAEPDPGQQPSPIALAIAAVGSFAHAPSVPPVRALIAFASHPPARGPPGILATL